jgi:hypothetical protein
VAQVGGMLGNIIIGSISDAFITSVSLHTHVHVLTCMYMYLHVKRR